MDDSDASALVEAALQHDDEAARALVRQLYPLVAKIVRAHRPRRTAEEDLCQMIFIRVFQKLSQFSGKVPLEHWVSRIAVNTCLNQIESERVRPELRHADLSEEEQAVVENLAVSSDELAPDQRFASRQLVEHLLAALKPVERLAIDLLYLQGRSVEEIRKITGWSAPLIKVRAFRARQKMKQQLTKLRQRKNDEKRKIDRLLRSAARTGEDRPAPMPFGFDTRVVALWRAEGLKPNGVTSLLRRVAILSAVVIVVSTIAAVQEARENREIGDSFTNEYAIADSAIQAEFSQ